MKGPALQVNIPLTSLLFALGIFYPASAMAQAPSAGPAPSATQWRLIGPMPIMSAGSAFPDRFRPSQSTREMSTVSMSARRLGVSGRPTIAGETGDQPPTTVFRSERIYRSNDGAERWQPISQRSAGPIRMVTVAPSESSGIGLGNSPRCLLRGFLRGPFVGARSSEYAR